MLVRLKDQLDREITLDQLPSRIISLVPSITETLFDLDLNNRVVGRTKFCIHPKGEISKVGIIGGTKNVDITKIAALNPDLIIANKEENTKEIIDQLSLKYPIYISDVKDVENALGLIRALGGLTGQISQSEDVINRITKAKQSFQRRTIRKAVYLIWKRPFMTIGNDTFIHQMMLESGFENVYMDMKRYPTIKLKDRLLETDVILLSSEPYPFNLDDVKALSEEFGKPVLLVDGEMFSWYGSRMIRSWPYFAEL